MVEMEQSDHEISLRYPHLSELVVSICDSSADSKAKMKITSSSSSVATTLGNTNSLECCSQRSSELLQVTSCGKLVDCVYKAAGCTERVPHGTIAEMEHHQSCKYRPSPCLMQHVCKQLVSYHNFLLHHMQHFIYPTFSRILNTSVVFGKEAFDCNHRWQPRWMNCYDKHFFVMILHKIPGMWYFWVCMLGTPEEAEEFLYDVEISKRHNKKIGTFSVLSFRCSEDELEKREICLSMTDYQVKRISQIKENMVGSLDLDLMIHKVSSSSKSRF